MNNDAGKGKNILVIRNDKLGDFMLAFPSFCLLKKALPDHRIFALVPEYTKDMAEACEWIDEVIIDPGTQAGIKGSFKLIKQLRNRQIDYAITLHSTERIGIALLAAGIKYRLAPASRIAQVFYNHKLVQRRSRSEMPEYKYNLFLIHHFLKQQGIRGMPPIGTPYLRFDPATIAHLETEFCQQHQLDKSKTLVFIHCGSGGSANNLSLAQYAQLGSTLHDKFGVQIVLTAGPGEQQQVQALSSLLNSTHHVVYYSNQGLVEFAKHIQFADIFISGSTGPLHIAGALDIPTVAFYPRRRSATSLRWQTINSEGRRLAFMPPESTAGSAQESDMSSMDMDEVLNKIGEHFFDR